MTEADGRDLFVVVPDLDMEQTLTALLGKRQPALKITLSFDAQKDLLRYNKRDSGCCNDAVELLRKYQKTHRHALLCFDRHGCGRDQEDPAEIARQLEEDLQRSGWPDGSVAVIVLDPELEAWVWADSLQVAQGLGWDSMESLRRYLAEKQLWAPGEPKPRQPKEALVEALKAVQEKPRVGHFIKLAENISLQNCQDAAFSRFCDRLQKWFGARS